LAGHLTVIIDSMLPISILTQLKNKGNVNSHFSRLMKNKKD